MYQDCTQGADAKQRTRVTMSVKIAHFPSVKTLDDFEFRFQPSIDHKLVRELATGRFIASAENVLIFGPPGVGKTVARLRPASTGEVRSGRTQHLRPRPAGSHPSRAVH